MKRTFSPWTSVALSTVAAAWLLAVPASAQDRSAGGGGRSVMVAAAPHLVAARRDRRAVAPVPARSSSGGSSSAPATSSGSSGGGASERRWWLARRWRWRWRRCLAWRRDRRQRIRRASRRQRLRVSAQWRRTRRLGRPHERRERIGRDVDQRNRRQSRRREQCAEERREVAPSPRLRSHHEGDNGALACRPYARPRDGQPVVGTAVPRGSVPAPGSGGVDRALRATTAASTIRGCTARAPTAHTAATTDMAATATAAATAGTTTRGTAAIRCLAAVGSDPQSSYSTYGRRGFAAPEDQAARTREVYVDGYFVGVVDDFDGIFQRLHVDSGPHRIEVRAPGYEPLAFDVRITPDHKTTYEGELKRLQ